MNAVVTADDHHVSVTIKLTDEDVEFLHDVRQMSPRETALLTSIGTETGRGVPVVIFLRVDTA